MGMPKGTSGNPNGRPAGVPNKSTQNAREAIATFVEGNVDRLTTWLDRIADENPDAAFKAFMSVVEYHIPKLARTELTGRDGDKIKQEISVSDKILGVLTIDQLKQLKNDADTQHNAG